MDMRHVPTHTDDQAATMPHRISGELVPVLEFELSEARSVYFEHYILLYKSPSVRLAAAMPRGALKRLLGKMPVFLTRAEGDGLLAVSRDGPGQVFGVHIPAGGALEVREHQFLAASGNLGYGFSRVRGVANLLLGGSGFFVDRFTASREPGTLWLHAYGNLVEVELGPGEAFDVEPGAWCYKDADVRMQLVPINVAAGLLSSHHLLLNRFTGPGRVGIQSMSVYLPSDE